MLDRRKKIRKEKEEVIKYSVEEDMSTLLNATISKNISEEGLCLQIYKKIVPGKNIIIRLHIPKEKQSIDVKAKIIWIKEMYKKTYYLAGIEIINTNPEILRLIKKWGDTNDKA